jgi:hypothetical protein
MEFSELRLFLHLSRTLHFGHTSSECHISASALSRAIQRLERDVGHALFERDNRSVQLTTQGARFREFAARVVDERDQLDQALSTQTERLRGTISIFATVTACQSFLPDLLSRFRRTHPDIPRGYRVPLYPVLPALGILSCFALIFTVENRVLIFFAWYVVAAIVLYFVYGMHNSELAKGHVVLADGEPPLFPEDAPLGPDGKPVMRP